MATATRKTTSFAITCPFCMDEDANVVVSLNDVGRCVCEGCQEEFTPADAIGRIQEHLARWERVAKWCEMAREIAAE